MSLDRVTHLLNNINLLVEERDWNQFHNPKKSGNEFANRGR